MSSLFGSRRSPAQESPALWTWAAVCAGIGVLAVVTCFAFAVSKKNPSSEPPVAMTETESATAALPDTPIPERHWTSLRSGPGGARVAEAALSSSGRFRLAGTFIVLGNAAYRKAILDDTKTGDQYLVAEDEHAGPALVLRVQADRVTIQLDGRTEELTLAYDAAITSKPGSGASSLLQEPAEGPPLETNAYGRRTQEDRWVISQEAITKYYLDLLDHPDRAAQLYRNFKPDMVDSQVKGYRLEIEGEGDFLNAVGLRNGDVIRQVNSMNMTSQSRAEYFIKEVLTQNLGAVVIDLERDGERKKLVYLME